ncbi:Eco57I restriction-modification methylase domain-containing protein [Massilia sp. LjRoot122]|uniref:Eco57I restriction-modification methylase domain-containing protein n=1 Tax=Massilia sp. LjRoot122 TaxID=3342257 RepID=UPI003ECC2BDF
MDDNNNLLLFAENDHDAARIEAIDQLHNATNYYTADAVVEQLLDHLDWPHDRGRMIDASCGAGAFIAIALTRALAARVFTDSELPHHLEGWELHPFACAQARARVASVLISFGRTAGVAAKIAEQIIHNKDFLTEAPTEARWHYHCGNPPYIRAANIPQILRDEYAGHVPKYASADLAHGFLDRAARTLFDGGKIGVVVADRILINSTAGALREALGTRLGIEHVERLDATTAFFRPKQRRKGTPARVHPLLLVMSPTGAVPLTKEPIYPGVDETEYAGLPTLQELAQVRLGSWLGTEGVFTVTPEQAAARGIPLEALVHAVDIDDIVDGDKLGPLKRYAIRTHPDHRPCDAVMAHLDATMHLMAEAGKKGVYWCPPERFHARDLSQVTLMVPRIAKTPRAIWVQPNTLPINHNLSIVSGDLELLAKIERALRGDLAAKWLHDHAPRIEGGFHSLETNLLRRMPIQLD